MATPLLTTVPSRSMPSGVAVTVVGSLVGQLADRGGHGLVAGFVAVELVVELAGGVDPVLQRPQFVQQARPALDGPRNSRMVISEFSQATVSLSSCDAVVVVARFLRGGEGVDPAHVVLDLRVAVAEQHRPGAQLAPFAEGQRIDLGIVEHRARQRRFALPNRTPAGSGWRRSRR